MTVPVPSARPARPAPVLDPLPGRGAARADRERRLPHARAVAARPLPGFWRVVLAVAGKDFRVELRARSAMVAALAFTALALSTFFFAWDPTAVGPGDLAPGVLWVALTFATLLGLHRSFGAEQPTRAIDALLAAPVEREAIFIGKLLANLGVVLVVAVVAVPAAALLYNAPLGGVVLRLAGVVTLAAVGMVTVGTLFSAMTVNTRLAELLLPLLALPFFVPVILPAAQATARLLGGRALSSAAGYLELLAAFDVIFLVACTLAYPYVLEE